jgi:hypothetical protein
VGKDGDQKGFEKSDRLQMRNEEKKKEKGRVKGSADYKKKKKKKREKDCTGRLEGGGIKMTRGRGRLRRIRDQARPI